MKYMWKTIFLQLIIGIGKDEIFIIYIDGVYALIRIVRIILFFWCLWYW